MTRMISWLESLLQLESVALCVNPPLQEAVLRGTNFSAVSISVIVDGEAGLRQLYSGHSPVRLAREVIRVCRCKPHLPPDEPHHKRRIIREHCESLSINIPCRYEMQGFASAVCLF